MSQVTHMSEPRDDYLPAFSFLQQAADATLIARNQYSYVLLACAIVGLVSVTLLVPKSGIVESLEQFVVPACSLAAVAATAPGTPPAETRQYIIGVLAAAGLASFRIAMRRYVEFHHTSELENTLRTALPALFGFAFLVVAASCRYRGARLFWSSLRVGIASTNACRLAVVLVLRLAVEPCPSSYPPDLSFGPALLFSIAWIAITAAATPQARSRFASCTGANAVSLRLNDIKQQQESSSAGTAGDAAPRLRAHNASTPPSTNASSKEEYIRHLEQTIQTLAETNRSAQEELDLLHASIGWDPSDRTSQPPPRRLRRNLRQPGANGPASSMAKAHSMCGGTILE